MFTYRENDSSALRSDAAVDFLAFDVETASPVRGSICAIGGAVGADGSVYSNFSWLVNPECAFADYNIWLHKIRPRDVEDAPTMPRLWSPLMEIFVGATLVAHHAGFDLGQLRSAAHQNQLDLPDLPVYCSVAIAKRVWPLLPSYKLSYLAQMLDFTYQHHEAGEDARACAMVVLAAEREQGVSSLRELAAALSLHPRNLGVAPRSNVLPTDRGDGEQHPLLGKRICFTRTLDSMTRSEAEAQVEDVGGIKRDNVSKLVDYLVIGDGHYADFLNGDITGKMKTAIALLAEGNKIEIIPESEFLTLLYS